MLYYNDALTGTISVTRVRGRLQGKDLVSLQINGKTDASTGDVSTQLLLAHLPALLHPAPRSALVIGLASGCTLGALERHRELQSIDCVEIEPAMAHVTSFFCDINRDCLRDPRVNLVLDDARNFVQVTPHRYDLITSEPSNPWIAGVANLFTREHFRNCRARLTPTGVFCQWIPLYNLSPGDLRSIAATFRDVFPTATLWMFPELATDGFLIGTLSPQALDVPRLAAGCARAGVRADLQAARVHDIWDFLGGCLYGPEMMTEISREAPLNTDDFPLLEFSAPTNLHSGIARLTLVRVLELARTSTPPLTRGGATCTEGYRTELLGLVVGRQWGSPRDEGFTVRRTPEEFLTGRPEAGIRPAATTTFVSATGEREVRARQEGSLPGEGAPAEPTGAPSRRLQVSGHEVRVWDRPDQPAGASWVAQWTCPQRGRVFTVIAREGPSSPTAAAEALSQVRCEH